MERRTSASRKENQKVCGDSTGSRHVCGCGVQHFVSHLPTQSLYSCKFGSNHRHFHANDHSSRLRGKSHEKRGPYVPVQGSTPHGTAAKHRLPGRRSSSSSSSGHTGHVVFAPKLVICLYKVKMDPEEYIEDTADYKRRVLQRRRGSAARGSTNLPNLPMQEDKPWHQRDCFTCCLQ